MRRIKGANSLFTNQDEQIMRYDRNEIIAILRDNRYHSPELSELDEEQENSKRRVNVYNPSWRSEEI